MHAGFATLTAVDTPSPGVLFLLVLLVLVLEDELFCLCDLSLRDEALAVAVRSSTRSSMEVKQTLEALAAAVSVLDKRKQLLALVRQQAHLLQETAGQELSPQASQPQ